MAEKFWYGGSPNHLGEWDYDNTSKADTIDNAAAVDKTGGKVGIPITGHPFAAADSVLIAGTTNYNGTYVIDSQTANEIVIVATYAAENFAGTETVKSTSNWKLASTGADTAKPADGDIIYFTGRAYDNPTTAKKQSADENIDATGTGTPDLAGLYISNDYDGDIGASDEYLELEADGDDIVFEGTGTMYFKLSNGTGADADCGKFVCNTPRGTVYLASLENDAGNVCLYAHVVAFSGRLYIDNGTAISTLTVTSRQAAVYGGSGCYRVKATAAYTDIYQIDGTINWNSHLDTLELYGGNFYWGTDGMTEIVSSEINLLKVYEGAVFFWQMAAATASTIKQFILYGGQLTAAVEVATGYNKIIGTGTEISELWTGATLNLNNNNHNITITASSKIECFGGTLVPPAGALIDW
jgi:hypothetical protein